MNLEGKIALITGGAKGIGFATAKRLLNERCIVHLWDNDAKALKDALKKLSIGNNKVFGKECDVTNRDKVISLTEELNSAGGIDILINNAGYVKGGDLTDVEDIFLDKTIEINLTSLIFLTKALLPKMYEKNLGNIINISSASSTLGVGGLSVYTATKWAVWGFTESMRFEAENKGKDGVKFSSIHPSYIAEGLFEGAKLNFWGNLIVPLLKSHDIIAKAIVNDCIKRGAYSPKRPRSVNLVVLLRGILPDFVFQRLLKFFGVNNSMKNWQGRK